MKKQFSVLVMAGVACLAVLASAAHAAEVTLVQNGVAQSAIYVAPEVMAADIKLPDAATHAQTQDETQRRSLRESVKDLSSYLGKISGAKVEVRTGAPVADKKIPILIGTRAEAKFKGVTRKEVGKQGFRVVATPGAVGLLGESDEATSYAIYEVLSRLGCRWYMPSDLGEVVPQRKTVTLPVGDLALVPGTLFRTIWYGDEAFKRRNRCGGVRIESNQLLENFITEEQRKAHPEWVGIINGKPDATRLKWSAPGLTDAVADAIIARLDKSYEPSISLSPIDGAAFDESDDRAWDAGDFDASMDQVSITDRYVKFCNLVVNRVAKKYPDVLFGFLAYVQYTRAPVREKPHPNLIPVIAPITYCRAHAMTDTELCPYRPQIRQIVDGWGKVSPRIAYYNYNYNLAEVSAPYPMMHQMEEELPILYKSHVKFWQPETMSNFESVLPGMVLSMRKAWNPDEDSQAILNELFTNFYGAAAKPMRSYWQTMDDAWIKVPAHAGCGFSYPRRFTPEVLGQARGAITAAVATAKTSQEFQRVQMQERSLRQFERFMQMRRDLNDGQLAGLDQKSTQWLGTQTGLGDEYEAQSAFTKAYWAKETISATYYKWFFEASHLDGARIARDYTVLGASLRDWQYATDKEKKGAELGWFQPNFDSAAWKTTDVGMQTWADLDLLNYMGTMWYRKTVKLPAVPAGKKVYLWISATDGSVKVFVNGKAIPYVNAKGESSEVFNGYCQPASFDITSAMVPGADNQITLRAIRDGLNELGTGGLLSAAYIYQEK